MGFTGAYQLYRKYAAGQLQLGGAAAPPAAAGGAGGETARAAADQPAGAE